MRMNQFVKLAMVAVILATSSGCTTVKRWFGWGGGAKNPETQVTEVPWDAETGAPINDQNSFAESREPVTGVSFSPVYFGFDSYQLAPVEVSKIEQVAQHLLQNSSHVVLIDGHCDERGSNEYNLSLGEQRAQTIRGYLASLGIDGGRVQTRSFGEEKPASQGRSEEAYRLNRRGEFGIYK
jgi:peptidoglycan-associated lipoprotein